MVRLPQYKTQHDCVFKLNHHKNLKMNQSILRTVAGGILIGALAFFAFKVVIALVVVGLLFKLFGRGRYGSGRFGDHRLAFADRIRAMDEDEYQNFKTRFAGKCGPRGEQPIQ